MFDLSWWLRRVPRRQVLGAVGAAALAVAGIKVAPVLADELPVDSNQDIVAPQVASLVIEPLSVDVTDGVNKTFTATLTATDDLSGVSYVSAYYRLSSSSQILSFSFQRTSGDDRNGTYSATTTVTPLQHNGTYAFSNMTVFDRVGNYRSYSVGDHPGPAELTVRSNADVIPPSISGVRVTPNPLDVRQSRQEATVEVDVTDDASGVATVQGQFQSPSGRQGAWFSATPVADQAGLARGRTAVVQYSEPGDWKLTTLCAYDRARNERCYGLYSTPRIGDAFPAQINVVSDPVDGTRPAVGAYRFSPSAIDVTTAPRAVSIDFDVSDDLSGVQYASATFRSPRTVGASPEIIERTAWAYAPSIYPYVLNPDGSYSQVEDDSRRLLSGTLTGTVTFPQYDRSGNWTLARLCVIDQVNWQRCYDSTSIPPLIDLGPTELVVEWNRAPVVTVTGVTGSSYEEGSEPTPGCDVTDAEDGIVTGIEPTIERSGQTVTVTCTYLDQGINGGQNRRSGTDSVTYTVTVPTVPTGPTLSGAPTTEPNAAGWYKGPVTIHWTVTPGRAAVSPEAVPADEVLSTDGADQTATASVTDEAGRTASATSAPPVDIDKTAPTVGAPSFGLNPLPTGQVSEVSAEASDALSGVAGGEFFVDSDPGPGNATAMTLSGGRLSASFGVDLAPGVHTVGVRALDRAGNWSSVATTDLTVSYASGAFVTGGGFIESPAGALTADATVSGRATFGFVSRYKKGTTAPSGTTQFRFRAGQLAFASVRYDWLVVSGAKAQFKGDGTLNGQAGYHFLLTATDGQQPGGGGVDRFRIKIWNGDGLVYDNGLGADDSSPGSAIGGGAVVIH